MQENDIEQRLKEALDRMESHEPGGDIIIFTASQAEALVEVAKWWIALRGAGKIGAAMGSALKWLALFVGTWVALKAGVLDWITSNLGGGK